MSDVPLSSEQRILRSLAASSRPLDDDELSRSARVRPRQQVNAICNRLARTGLILRQPGGNGKLVNVLADSEPPATSAAPEDERMFPGGSSAAQRAAEPVMLAALSGIVGRVLFPQRIDHPSGARVEIDGADEELTILAECWAHQGPAKVAQRSKLVSDATKLHWIAASIDPSPERLILCVSDEASVKHLRGRSWQRYALAELGVELVVVELPDHVTASIREAQVRQSR